MSQEPTLFSGTIFENIAAGKPGGNATTAEVEEAAKLSNAHGFISAFKQGYETQVGEKGVQLSGGQKQRIAIARAIVRDPSILILDEATSALDLKSEKVVQQALDDVMRVRSMTTIVVAHRLSTVKNANRIVVIDKGAVQEVGTHHELLSRPGSVYRSLVKRQLEGPDAD